MRGIRRIFHKQVEPQPGSKSMLGAGIRKLGHKSGISVTNHVHGPKI